MRASLFRKWIAALLAGAGLWIGFTRAQETRPQLPQLEAPQPAAPAPLPQEAAPAAETASGQKGVEVLTRGPIHEAFAAPSTEPVETTPVAKKPPKAIEEMPPDEKPAGDSTWISGYWAWDDDRADYLWVSGTWRVAPPGKQWVAGYWREAGEKWQWVPGFWVASSKETEAKHEVTYLPKPPEPPETAAPGAPPTESSFFVPGHWEWRGDRYAWRPGYWAKVEPGYVWVQAHFRWTPTGYVYIPGYWDLALARRGVLYAPVVVNYEGVPATFVYTPTYAVPETVVVDCFFVRPCYGHYYYGDYYGDRYHDHGFECVLVYNRRHYDSIIVYERWDHRAEPRWETSRVEIFYERDAGRAPRPPRTLVEQRVIEERVRRGGNTTNVYNITIVKPAAQVVEAKGMKTVPVAAAERAAIHQQARAVQEAAVERRVTEAKLTPATASKPSVASLPASHPTTAASHAGSVETASHLSPPPGGKPTDPAKPGTTPAKPGTKPGTKPPPPGTHPPPPEKPENKPKPSGN